jgi:selenocysteine-specific elongation factor
VSHPLVLGTAGHIDHGKTTLVQALTGTWADRLPEERARGMTIALGYALLRLPSGRRVSVVDVPGHERFVRTMVAGATGIDVFLLVVAADDGVMPQTVEHVEVLRALGVQRGVVAVTKADVADPVRAAREARDLVGDAETVACDARSGAGVEELVRALDRVAAATPGRAGRPGPPVLHVDRSFTVEGRGTVVTGTLWSGTIRTGDRLELVAAGTPARVRGLEVHGAAVEEADAGQRVAVNLAGVRAREAQRATCWRRRARCGPRRSWTAGWTCATRPTGSASRSTTARATAPAASRTCARTSGSCAWRPSCWPARATTSSCAATRRPTPSAGA